MKKFPIFLIDNHLKLKLIHMLILIKILGKNTRNTSILTGNKISYLHFLSKHNLIKKKIFTALGVKHSNLEEENIISNHKADIIELIDRKESKDLLKLLIMYKIVEIELIKDKFYYYLSYEGEEVFKNIVGVYFEKLIKEMKFLKPVARLPESKLFNSIIEEIK